MEGIIELADAMEITPADEQLTDDSTGTPAASFIQPITGDETKCRVGRWMDSGKKPFLHTHFFMRLLICNIIGWIVLSATAFAPLLEPMQANFTEIQGNYGAISAEASAPTKNPMASGCISILKKVSRAAFAFLEKEMWIQYPAVLN